MAERKKAMAEEQVTSVFPAGEIPVYEREYTADEEVLAALGYKPEFKREFSLWTSFCVSFAVLGLLPSFASTLYYVSARKDKVLDREGVTRLMVASTGHGIRSNTRHDMGLAHRHDLHPMRRNEHGRTKLRHADEWRIILRSGSPGPVRMGTSGGLSAPRGTGNT